MTAPSPAVPAPPDRSGPPRLRSRLTAILPDPGHGRILAAAQLVGSLGAGLYLAGAPVYFLKVAGLSVGQIGLGLSIAGLAGIAVSVLSGRLADAFGARRMAVLFVLLQAVFVVALLPVRSFWAFVPVVALVSVAEQSWDVSRDGMIAAVMKGQDRVRISAYLRSVFNGGFTVGTLLAGLALAVNSTSAYLALLLTVAACSITVAVLYLRLPGWPRPAPAVQTRPARTRLADLPYVLLAQVSCLTRLGETILLIGLPLWIVSRTDVPRPIAAWLIGVNTILVVLLQVRVARAGRDIASAARLQRLAFLLLALACLIAAVTGRLPVVPAGVALVAVAVVLTLAELAGETARWTLQFGLAPENAQGRAAGLFRLGQAVPMVAGPALVTGLTMALGATGWLALAAIMLGAMALSAPVVSWARRARPEPVTEPALS